MTVWKVPMGRVTALQGDETQEPHWQAWTSKRCTEAWPADGGNMMKNALSRQPL